MVLKLVKVQVSGIGARSDKPSPARKLGRQVAHGGPEAAADEVALNRATDPTTYGVANPRVNRLVRYARNRQRAPADPASRSQSGLRDSVVDPVNRGRSVLGARGSSQP